jgi:hypothetical protein
VKVKGFEYLSVLFYLVVVELRPTLPVEDISLLFGIDMADDKVNYHLLHSDGDISHYFIDKGQKSCLHTDED